jgi:tRNA nucleotidyltransferase/poly(A) polymerase
MMDVIPSPPGFVRWATQTLEDAGFETWAVGGAIRNTLLGIASGDWDLATRAPPEVVRELFPRTVPIGIAHGTVGVLTRSGTMLEVTTFRKDVETFGRKAAVEFADTLSEDLSRRDFTVNAIAWHPLTGGFQDPHGGRADLEAGILRTVGDPRDRFSEDYLRVLRGLRFSGRFRLRIEKATWEALRGSAGRLGVLSPERVREELMKVLMDDPRPSGALSLYRATGIMEALYPEVLAGGSDPRRTSQGDLWTHSLLLADALSPRRPLLRLAALFQGVTKGKGDRGNDRTAALMIRLRFSNAEIRAVTDLIRTGLEAPTNLRSPRDLRHFLHEMGPENLPSLARIWLAEARLDRQRWGDPPHGVVRLLGALREQVASSAPIRSEDLALTGRDLISLGLRPGPHFGEILEALMGQVLDDPALNRPEVLRELAMDWWAREGGDAR